jgi:hypothetical protein
MSPPVPAVPGVRRLGLGIEPEDAVRRSRIGHPVELWRDGGPEDRRGERFRRRRSCRFALMVEDAVPDPVGLRLTDPAWRFVPRRLAVSAAAGRICRPALFPGPAYDLPVGAVAVRGRVLRGGEPVRWARAEALRPGTGVVIGRAHGDHRGEFLLLVGPGAAATPALALPIAVVVRVFGPDAAPVPGPEAAGDALWDLPVEPVPVAGGEGVLRGETVPDGYVSREGSTLTLELGLDGPMSVEFDFS